MGVDTNDQACPSHTISDLLATWRSNHRIHKILQSERPSWIGQVLRPKPWSSWEIVSRQYLAGTAEQGHQTAQSSRATNDASHQFDDETPEWDLS
mmetsp:Transcript_8146/g.15768  ORF Transcript_8146/g.15768 Transcript_8146/m.15768 type:complete len:95 (-) Transcript_8146:1291-1575(-)